MTRTADFERGKYHEIVSNETTVSKKELGRHWDEKTRIKWMITYFLGCLLVYSVRSSISICAAAMGKDLGWNKHVAGMALSAFFCGYLTTNVIGGYLSDKYGGERVVFYTSLSWATLTMLLPILAHSRWILSSGTIAVLITRFLTGVSQGVYFPSLTSIITNHVSVAERSFVYGFSNSGASLGTVLTGFFGSIIIEKMGWPSVFILIGATSLLWAVWLRYLDVTHNYTTNCDDKFDVANKEPVPWRALATSRPVWALFISFFCQSYCFYNVLTWAPVYFHDAFPESKGWIFNVVPWIFAFLFSNLTGYCANKLVSKGFSVTFIRKLYVSVLFLGIATFSMILTSVETFQHALLTMTVIVACNAFATCSIALNTQDLAPKHAGALHGVMNSNGALAGFVGVYLTGHILETTNSWSTVFMSTAVVSLVGFFTFIFFGSGEAVV